jgi:hypothetical protein
MGQNNLYFSNDEIISLLHELQLRIEKLEARQHCFSQQPVIVHNMTVSRLDAEKLQFNLDEISVQELTGTLNIGINRHKSAENSEKDPKPLFQETNRAGFIPNKS